MFFHQIEYLDIPAKKMEKNAARLMVNREGLLQLSEQQRRKWGLESGADLLAFETPEGLLLRPANTPMSKIYLEPTTTCNLECSTCIRNSWNETVGSMEMGTYLHLIEGLHDVPSLHTIAFWGFGEPLLHPNMLEMVEMAKTLGVKTELITNGLLLDRDMAEGLVMAGLDTLVVSVDGATPESQAAIRSGADLRLIQENMKGLRVARRIRSSQNPEIGIEFVLMRRNLSELPKLRELAYSMGASFILLTNILPYTEELKDEILYGVSASHSNLFRRSRWFPEIFTPRIDSRSAHIEALSRMKEQAGSIDLQPSRCMDIDERCPFVWEGAVAVARDGEVSPCVALMHSYTCYVLGREKFIRRYSVGNLEKERIKDIWKKQEYVEFRERVLKFDFSPCLYCCGCNLVESNEEDCFGSVFPVCGDCLWAKGILLCP
jgi:MoaA/NifB/PqqE/SkfB family radical SAM enzyme